MTMKQKGWQELKQRRQSLWGRNDIFVTIAGMKQQCDPEKER